MGASCNGCPAAQAVGGQCAAMHAPGCNCSLDLPQNRYQKTRLRVGCCSGLWDAPLHLALEKMDLQHLTISLNWVRCPPDAGAVMSMLSSGLIDVALMYTEDAVAFIAEANPLRITGTYVNTPRSWGLHVHHSSPIRTVADLRGLRVGHTEEKGAYLAIAILGDREGCGDIISCQRETFGSIRKSADAMMRGVTQATLWDSRSVKHLVASGDWECIAEVELQWPSVVIVGSKESLYCKAGAVRQFIHFARSACEDFISFSEDDALRYLSACHGLGMQDALQFMSATDWVCENKVALDTILKPLEYLKQIGYVDCSRRFDPMRFVAKELCIDPVRGLPMISDDECDDEDSSAVLPPELASVTSFPAELPPFPQNDMESNTDESFSQRLQLDGEAPLVGLGSVGHSQPQGLLLTGVAAEVTEEHREASFEEESETAVALWIRETGKPQCQSVSGATCAARSDGSDDGGGASIGDGAESVEKGGASVGISEYIDVSSLHRQLIIGGTNLEAGVLQESLVPKEHGPVPAG